MNLSQGLSFFYERGIQDLKKELEAYPDTESLWKQLPGTLNSGGTLFLHLIGNLQHFVIKGLAKTDFIRDRKAEFSTANTPKEEIARELNRVEGELKEAFTHLSDDMLLEDFPISWREGQLFSAQFMLNQMAVHLNYHLGQINYHRRYFTSN